MTLTADEVLAILRDTGTLREGHFLLTSGRHSNRFLLLAQALQHPAQAERLCRALAEPFQGQRIETVIGPAVGGIILAFEVARALGARAIFAEKTGDGGMALRRGFALRPGERVLVVEDAVSTGGSVSRVIGLVRAAGALPLGASVIADRTGGRLDLGLPLRALVTLDIPSWSPAECPLCRAGTPLVQPKD
ncbi:MAG: orotate phosphoribosyltransferase [Chloroflexi bacterium]|nr:orotate phosphoribosyltransferase [Chloroflexota bacterium]